MSAEANSVDIVRRMIETVVRDWEERRIDTEEFLKALGNAYPEMTIGRFYVEGLKAIQALDAEALGAIEYQRGWHDGAHMVDPQIDARARRG